jgi:hypothetical protein
MAAVRLLGVVTADDSGACIDGASGFGAQIFSKIWVWAL